jgi:polynucleotide 5'-hydroxyl-kinase GRC3/NOL9
VSHLFSTSLTWQIYTSEDIPKRAVLQELVSPAKWNKKLSGMAAAKRKGTPVVFLCGPKSSGKSTFGRLLANRLMTDRGGSKHTPWSSVMILDLDPGQPEYSPPGVISLSKIVAPNLSPSFCHPTLSPAQGLLRAHAIASVTPALDPAHFIECVLDLFAHYQRGPDAKCPLVINTPGWIQGTGLDILSELITSIRPTEVIYMSQDGPEETVNSLQSACTTAPPIPFSALPSQPSEGSSSRTPLHLRTMQTMSYFHLRQTEPLPSWDPTPLTDMRPWRVRYAGKDRGFRGILCYDHQPAPELLSEAINGTILALVKVESRAAFRDLLHGTEAEADPHPDANADTHSIADADADLETDPANNTSTPNNPPTNTANPTPPQKTDITTTTPKPEKTKEMTTSIPLIPNPLGQTLSPHHSHCLGLVLVRGIDAARSELQLLTPLSGAVLTSLRGGEEELVLVAGRFDTPSWAYCEGLYSGGGGGKGGGEGGKGGGGSEGGGDDDGESEGESDEGGEEDGEDEESEGEGKEGEDGGREVEVPWVEMLHGSQKRAVGSKVWRVRRDLGRN